MVKVTGIDIGSANIRLIELDGSARRYKVTRSVTIPRTLAPPAEEDAGEGEFIDDPSFLIDDLEAAFQDQGVARDRALLAVSGSHCVIRNMTLPFRGKDEIRKVLKFEAESYIHSHSIDDVVVDAVVVEERDDGTDMLMVACPKDVLGAQLRALQKAGVALERADLDSALLVAAARELGVVPGDDENEMELVLDIGAHSIQMAVLHAGELRMLRVLRWGTTRIESELADQLSLTKPEVRAAIAEFFGGPQLPTFDEDGGHEDGGGDDSQGGAVIVAPVRLNERDFTVVSGKLADKILREVTRFLSGIGASLQPARILVSGGGSALPGLIPALSDSAHAPVMPLELLRRADVDETLGSEYDVAFAAALAAIGATRPAMNFRQEELSFRPKFDRLKLPLAILTLVLTICLLAFAVQKKRDITRVEGQIGLIYVNPKKSKKKKSTRGKKLPEYTGVLRQIAHPQKSASYLQTYLHRGDALPILEKLKQQNVRTRPAFVVRELKRLKRNLEKATGYFAEVRLPSGLAVLRAISAVFDTAAKDPAIHPFVVPSIHLAVGATKRAPGSLKFTIAFRGDDFRAQKARFLSILRTRIGPQGPFASVSEETAVQYPGGLNPGADYPFKIKLNTDIPVFQTKVVAGN